MSVWPEAILLFCVFLKYDQIIEPSIESSWKKCSWWWCDWHSCVILVLFDNKSFIVFVPSLMNIQVRENSQKGKFFKSNENLILHLNIWPWNTLLFSVIIICIVLFVVISFWIGLSAFTFVHFHLLSVQQTGIALHGCGCSPATWCDFHTVFCINLPTVVNCITKWCLQMQMIHNLLS